MKKIIIITFIISFNSCQFSDSGSEILTDAEWYDALTIGGTLAGLRNDEFYLYQFYENKELAEVIKSTYLFGAKIFSYQTSDSVMNYIQERSNKLITNQLDTLLNITFRADTTNITEDYMLLSEPFNVDKELLCFSMTYKNSNYSNGHWIYFFKKSAGFFKIEGFYNVNTDSFYETSKLSE